jgi:hypothetical protein
MTGRTRPAQTLRRIFAVPAALGVATGIGLIGALVGDDLWDAVGWAGLGLPIAVMLRFMVRPAAPPQTARHRR